MQCSNNLKQIGLAAHSYESAHGSFPVGSAVLVPTDAAAPFPFTNNNAVGCLAYLLPHLEQNNVHSQLQVNWDPYVTAAGSAWYSNAANTAPARTRIKTFECPSAATQAPEFYIGPHRMMFDARRGAVSFQAAVFGAGANLGITNYIGVGGRFSVMGSNLTTGGEPVDNWRGLFVASMVIPFGAPLAISSIQRTGNITAVGLTDGTSNTLMFGETVGDGLAAGPNGPITVRVAWSWISAGWRPTFDGLMPPASRDFGSFSSNHTTVVNFVFCDGSVRTVRAPTSGAVTTQYVNASTIRRGEVIDFTTLGQ
jgi:prepilin-type processing-associated H-X9-DG protein